jgi:antitoxin component YwqK of YwqJK toxin-antitoxin module
MIKLYEEFSKEPEVQRGYWDNGQIRSESWYLNGKYYREDGPAYQYWNSNGQIKFESWYLNDKLHREDGPSFQEWYDNGQKMSEHWYLKGNKHREDGPSIQYWYEDGQKKSENWWLNGKFYSREKWVNELKVIDSKYYDEQKMLLNIEKYNL